MRLWFEIGLIFLDCVALSLACVLCAYPRVRSPLLGSELTPRQECMFNLMLVAPFGLFALGAVIHAQLHQGMLAPRPALLIVALFMIYPVACLAIVLRIEERRRRRRLIASGWGRSVDLDELMKPKEVS